MSYSDGSYRPFAPFKVVFRIKGETVAFFMLGKTLDSIAKKALEEIKKFDSTDSARFMSITEISLDINDGQEVKTIWVESTIPGSMKLE